MRDCAGPGGVDRRMLEQPTSSLGVARGDRMLRPAARRAPRDRAPEPLRHHSIALSTGAEFSLGPVAGGSIHESRHQSHSWGRKPEIQHSEAGATPRPCCPPTARSCWSSAHLLPAAKPDQSASLMPGLQESMMADPRPPRSGWPSCSPIGARCDPGRPRGHAGADRRLPRHARAAARFQRPTVGQALPGRAGRAAAGDRFYLLLALGFVLVLFVVGALMAVTRARRPGGRGCVVVGFYVMIKLSLTLAVIAIEKVSNPLAACAAAGSLPRSTACGCSRSSCS